MHSIYGLVIELGGWRWSASFASLGLVFVIQGPTPLAFNRGVRCCWCKDSFQLSVEFSGFDRHWWLMFRGGRSEGRGAEVKDL